MVPKGPCKDCTKRTPDCHGKCDGYLVWKKMRREETIQTNKDKAALDRMYDYGGKWRRCRYYRKGKK